MRSRVYFIKASIRDGERVISDQARRLFQAGGFAGCFKANDFTAVKVHVGEDGNNTYIKAPYIKGLVEELVELNTKPFVTDTSTLYVGQRNNACNHTMLAAKHGFHSTELGIPFIVSDGLFGTTETAVPIDGRHHQEVFIASDIVRSQAMLSIAHVTGHMAAGFGATLKTLGMGCASKKGKLKQHAALKLSIGNLCTLCGECLKYCPVQAIRLGKIQARIDQGQCIGCAECTAHCRFGAVQCNWGQETEILQENIAEYALGTLTGKDGKAAFFNFLLSITQDCDCFDTPDMHTIVEDIGIIASIDPVAVDRAALDLVEKTAGRKFQSLLRNSRIDPGCQIQHAERLGLGRTDYELVEIG